MLQSFGIPVSGSFVMHERQSQPVAQSKTETFTNPFEKYLAVGRLGEGNKTPDDSDDFAKRLDDAADR